MTKQASIKNLSKYTFLIDDLGIYYVKYIDYGSLKLIHIT